MPLVVVGETGLIGSAIKAKNLSNTLNFLINEWTIENVATSLRNLKTEWEISKSPIDLVWAAGKSNNSSNQATLDFEIEIVKNFLKNLSNSGLKLKSLNLISSAGSIFGGYDNELISNNTVLASASNIASNTATINASILIPNKPHTLKLWSVRDEYESYQTFEHSFFVEAVSLILMAVVSNDKVIGSTVPTANISVNVDESLKANMQSDGSKITVKTQAGATITIEVEE